MTAFVIPAPRGAISCRVGLYGRIAIPDWRPPVTDARSIRLSPIENSRSLAGTSAMPVEDALVRADVPTCTR
jgi:hypothetical protein